MAFDDTATDAVSVFLKLQDQLASISDAMQEVYGQQDDLFNQMYEECNQASSAVREKYKAPLEELNGLISDLYERKNALEELQEVASASLTASEISQLADAYMTTA